MNDLKSFFKQLKIPVIDSGVSVTRGWIGLNCPYCGDGDFHLGFNAKRNLFSCWRCGTKPFMKTMVLLTGLNVKEINKELPAYYIKPEEEDETQIIRPSTIEFPAGTMPLQTRHKRYLKSRGFDCEEVEKIWGLKGTLEDSDLPWRVIIPITFQGKMVSYTSRDITDKSKMKAITCENEKEVIHHKDIVFGFDQVNSNTVIVTEGPFDAMKLGPGAVCTFGIKYSEEQIELLGAFKNIFIVFDSKIDKNGNETEEQAQFQAERLADSLSIMSNVWIIDDFKTDPADFHKRQVDKLRKRIEETIQKENEKCSKSAN